MVSSGPAGPGELPLADVTGRMAVFGRLFSEHVGVHDPIELQTATEVVDTVRTRVPRTSDPAEDAPIFEAAAFLGEWLRAWTDAAWVAEGPLEPHLQVVNPSRSIVYLLPLISIVRVASTAGYDGLPALLDRVLADSARAPARLPIARLPVQPEEDQPRVARWVERHRHVNDACRASLWRRCQMCSTLVEDAITLHNASDDWEKDASTAAGILARRPFNCACGGPPGEASRFLLLRERGGETRLADLYVAAAHTRIASWRLRDGEAEPLDATTLAVEASH